MVLLKARGGKTGQEKTRKGSGLTWLVLHPALLSTPIPIPDTHTVLAPDAVPVPVPVPDSDFDPAFDTDPVPLFDAIPVPVFDAIPVPFFDAIPADELYGLCMKSSGSLAENASR